MRDNPDNNMLGNLVGREADNSDPETPSQNQVARDPDYINISEVIDNRVNDVVRENSDHINISETSDKRISDIKKENNNQLNEYNIPIEQSQQRQSFKRFYHIIISI
jgi:hypothetical protein